MEECWELQYCSFHDVGSFKLDLTGVLAKKLSLIAGEFLHLLLSLWSSVVSPQGFVRSVWKEITNEHAINVLAQNARWGLAAWSGVDELTDIWISRYPERMHALKKWARFLLAHGVGRWSWSGVTTGGFKNEDQNGPSLLRKAYCEHRWVTALRCAPTRLDWCGSLWDCRIKEFSPSANCKQT
jgi:hypothetical protein